MIGPSLFCFLFFYIISFMMVIHLNDWFLVWLGMEINMLTFIFLIYIRDNMMSIESCLKYFFIQSLGSSFFISIVYLNEFKLSFMSSMILIYKMGGGPFFFWFPSICGGVSWLSCLLLMSFQKIIPLLMINNFLSWMMWVMIFSSLILGVLGSFNQLEMKKLLAFSSINHIGWLLICSLIDSEIWMIYLFCYLLILIPVVLLLMTNEINNYFNLIKMKYKFTFIFFMMNMGGVPPMLGFFLKWMSFYYISFYGVIMIMFLIFVSIMMLYVYIRLSYNMLLGSMYLMIIPYKIKPNIENMSIDMFSMLGLILYGMIMSYIL